MILSVNIDKSGRTGAHRRSSFFLPPYRIHLRSKPGSSAAIDIYDTRYAGLALTMQVRHGYSEVARILDAMLAEDAADRMPVEAAIDALQDQLPGESALAEIAMLLQTPVKPVVPGVQDQ